MTAQPSCIDGAARKGGLFGSDPNHMEALLGWRGQAPDWADYAIGYRRAVERLIEHTDERASHQDTLVFPVGALCRHAIELALKRVLVLLHTSFALSETIKLDHDLTGLWRAVAGPAKRLRLIDEGAGKRIAARIAGFVELDPSGCGVSLSGDQVGRDASVARAHQPRGAERRHARPLG